MTRHNDFTSGTDDTKSTPEATEHCSSFMIDDARPNGEVKHLATK
jgi:hypothetical protein